MKQRILFPIVSLIFTQMALCQIELNSAGRVGIGVAPNSSYDLIIAGSASTGLYVITNNTTNLMAGIRTQSYEGTSNYGLVSYAFYGTTNYGAYAYAVKDNFTSTGYGIYGKVDRVTTGKNAYAGYFTLVGTDTTGNNYAGYFNGDLAYTGSLKGC